MDKTIYGQAFRFACTGVVNTLAGMAVMFGLYNIFGCSYWVSSAVNYTAVSVLSYFLNRKITFGYSGKVLKSGIRFAVKIPCDQIVKTRCRHYGNDACPDVKSYAFFLEITHHSTGRVESVSAAARKQHAVYFLTCL